MEKTRHRLSFKEAIGILENEISCVKAAEFCSRDCARCSLVKNPEDIIEALDMAITLLRQNQ